MQTPTTSTLLDLVQRVSAGTDNEREVVATVANLVNSGRVRLCGTFAGAKIALPPARSGSFRLKRDSSMVMPLR